MKGRIALALGALLLLAGVARADGPEDSALVQALRDELARAESLRMEGAPGPHYLAYGVLDVAQVDLVAEFGGIVQDDVERTRFLRIDLRVGTPAFDSGNTERQGFFVARLPIDDDPIALRRQIWWSTDRAYKASIEALEAKRAEEVGARNPDRVPDFAPAPVARTVVQADVPMPDRERLRGLAMRLSAELRDATHVFEGGVRIRAVRLDRYLVSNDGRFGFEPGLWIQWAVVARTQADDGMNLVHHDGGIVRSMSDLPGEAELAGRVRAAARELAELREAPAPEAYVGPVLFEGEAAGALLRQLLVPHLLGTPPPSSQGVRISDPVAGGSTFTRRVGKRVAPRWLSLEDDPRPEREGGERRVGTYAFDDEGIPAERVELIERGRFVGFLMSRIPARGFPRSNGHGRGGLLPPRAQIGNLFLETREPLSRDALRARALREAQAAGERFAVVVRRLDDPSITRAYWGADFQQNASVEAPVLQAFQLYPDGRERPMRGLSLVTRDPRALKDLLAAGDRSVGYAYFAPAYEQSGGYWGSFPVYAVGASIQTPSLLFEEIELAPTPSLRTAPPIVSSPVTVEHGGP